MIERILIQNYRIFKDLDFQPNALMNVIVGDNEAGKSTLIEAIGMAVEGRLHGRPLREELSPYWFNSEVVEEYFKKRLAGENASPPEILIEVYMSRDDEPQVIRGRVNSAAEDCPGFAVEVSVDPDYSAEFEQYIVDYCRQMNAHGTPERASQPGSEAEGLGQFTYKPPTTLPIEYFRVTWRGFDNKALYRRPKDFDILYLDSYSTQVSRHIDFRSRRLLGELVDTHTNAEISVKHRQQRHVLTAELLAHVNAQIKESDEHFGENLSLEIDQSFASSWESAVIPHVKGLPFSHTGQGQQVLIKTSLALTAKSRTPRLIFIEEPENHLSHTSLFHVLKRIERLSTDRQVFITTHSSFVLNRLGLKNLHLLYSGKRTAFEKLSDETEVYFQKQPGYDTLRMVLARKLVIVEGPSDEMIFRRAYEDRFDKSPEDDLIDVITQGTRYARALELCAELDRAVAVLRDNDGQQPGHWIAPVSEYLEDGRRQLFVSDPTNGRTLEPQMVSANRGSIDKFREVIGCPQGKNIEAFMTGDKTAWALRVALSETKVNYPAYINDALEFLEGL